MSVKTTKLHNGLTIIGESNRVHKSSCVAFFVNTGSRDETSRESGISHYLEHMMFKGSAKRDALKLTYDMGKIGSQANAYTSEDATVYYQAVLPEYFKDATEILCDMLRPSLEQAEFDTEKKVILEEIALYQDRPQFYFFENATRIFFQGHPAGNSVLGTTESVSEISSDQMRDYLSRRYSPDNMIMVAAGDFSWEQFVEQVTTLTDKRSGTSTKRQVEGFAHSGSTKKILSKKGINQGQVLLMSTGPSVRDNERYPLALLSMIIGDATGSKLYWELIEKGLVDSASADLDEKVGTGIFLAYASCEEKNLDQVSEIIRSILSKPMDFSEADLERAKTKLITRIALNGELPMGRLMALGNRYLYNQKIHSLEEEIATVKGITRNSISDALNKFPLHDWAEYRLVAE